MYSPQLLRVHHDDMLRYAETRRLVKQAVAEAREAERFRPERPRPQRHRVVGLTLRRRLRHA